jgi:hypothetical protein
MAERRTVRSDAPTKRDHSARSPGRPVTLRCQATSTALGVHEAGGLAEYRISAGNGGGILKQLAGQEFEEQEMEPDDTTELACRFMPSCRFAALGMAPPRRADEALDVRERLQ